MTEYSPRPGTVRSKLGREEIEEPCTRKSTGSGASPVLGAFARFRNMTSLTGPFSAAYSALQIFAASVLEAARTAAGSRPAPAIMPRRETLRLMLFLLFTRG